MAIRKAKQKEYHARVPNDTARDKGISLEAKGLLCVLLSMDEDWIIYRKQIADFSTNKYHSTNNAFNELIENGYIIDRGRHRDNKGLLKDNEYEVFSERQIISHPIRGFQDLDNQDLDNQHLSNTIINNSNNKEKENKEESLISNEESVDSSENPQNNLFGETLESSQEPKSKKTKKESPRAHPSYREMVKFFCEEYWPDYTFFGARDGEQINGIIKQIERMLIKHGEESSPDRVVEFFKAVVTNAPAFYQKKSLPTINSKFSEIVEEIKKQRNGQTSKAGNSYLTADL